MVRRRYCDDVCPAQAYRDRQTAERAWGLGLMLGEAEWTGDTGMIRLLTCPVCGRITFASGGRRRNAVYCSGTASGPGAAARHAARGGQRDVQPSRTRPAV
ncbi:hypothetical protein AB0N06_37510 [Streptomyces sp. NPDC051020]|uniref:hypothetical protein n=1 Tax=Streptomyces sp. NPDC051020 TaxID=3155409 RepID=UPI00342276EA